MMLRKKLKPSGRCRWKYWHTRSRVYYVLYTQLPTDCYVYNTSYDSQRIGVTGLLCMTRQPENSIEKSAVHYCSLLTVRHVTLDVIDHRWLSRSNVHSAIPIPPWNIAQHAIVIWRTFTNTNVFWLYYLYLFHLYICIFGTFLVHFLYFFSPCDV